MTELLAQLLACHLVGDFILQPSKWIQDRARRHSKSRGLIGHVLIHGALVVSVLGPSGLIVAAWVMLTHWLIDLAKSYASPTTRWFVVDQASHVFTLMVIARVAEIYYPAGPLWLDLSPLSDYQSVISWIWPGRVAVGRWHQIAAWIAITSPAGYLISNLLKSIVPLVLPEKTETTNSSLSPQARMGLWIGMAERLMLVAILTMPATPDYQAVGLALTAKSIIRIGENKDNRPQTEYLLLGTFVSVLFALVAAWVITM